MGIVAAVALVAGVLFAALPYTVPVRSSGTNNAECDGAVFQVFGSPKFGFEPESGFSPDGSPWSSIKNFKPPCESVAHYRIGIAAGFLTVALVLGACIVLGVRRERQDTDLASTTHQSHA